MLQKAEETRVVKYSVVDAEIAKWRDIYLHLTIDDLDDKEQFDAVHSARMVVKNKRVEIEKERKSLKADALKWGKLVDDKAKEIFAKLEPIESHLSKEENKVAEEQKRIEAEEAEKERKKRDKRFDDLLAVGVSMPIMEIAVLTDDEFQCLLDDKTFEFEERQKAKAEAERLEKERLAKEAADRKAEDERLAKQREEQDAERERLEKIQADLNAQSKAIQDEKDRIAQEAADKQAAENAKIQAKKDAEDLAKHQAKEAAEAEEKAKAEAARQEALKPDKEKVLDWLCAIEASVDTPVDIENEEVEKFIGTAADLLYALIEKTKQMTEKL